MKNVILGLSLLCSLSTWAVLLESISGTVYVVNIDGKLLEVHDQATNRLLKASEVVFRSGNLIESRATKLLYYVNENTGFANPVKENARLIKSSDAIIH